MLIVNMTASLKFSERIDITRILEQQPFFASRNRGFDAISLTLQTKTHDTVTALIYASGSVVFVGAKSMEKLSQAKDELIELVGSPLLTQLQIHNVVATYQGEPVSLHLLYEILRKEAAVSQVSFEPEIFPALTFSISGTNRKACVFRSGRVNITGCRNEKECEDTLSVLCTIYSFIKKR